MFYESTLKPAAVVAALFWFVGWVVIIADLLMPHDDLGHVGLAFLASGAVVQVRGYYLSLRSRLDDTMLDSEVRALRDASRPRSLR